MLARLSLEAARVCPILIKKGNINLITDVAHAAILLESAFTCSSFNIEVNLGSFADKNLAKRIRKELKLTGNDIFKIRRETEEKVGKIIRR